MKTRRSPASVFLPMAIAFGLLAVAFRFDSGSVQWFWESRPEFAALFGLVGIAFFVAYALTRRADANR